MGMSWLLLFIVVQVWHPHAILKEKPPRVCFTPAAVNFPTDVANYSRIECTTKGDRCQKH
jgi:hypothetical protein